MKTSDPAPLKTRLKNARESGAKVETVLLRADRLTFVNGIGLRSAEGSVRIKVLLPVGKTLSVRRGKKELSNASSNETSG